MPTGQTLLDLGKPRLQIPVKPGQRLEGKAGDSGQQGSLARRQLADETCHLGNSCAGGDPELGQVSADGMQQHRPLFDSECTGPVQRRRRSLLDRLDRHEPLGRPCSAT